MTAAPDRMSSGLQHELRITASGVVFSTSGLGGRNLPHLTEALDLLLTGTGGVNAGIKVRDFPARMDDRAHLP